MSSDDAEKGNVVESSPHDIVGGGDAKTEEDVAGEAKTEIDDSFDIEGHKEKLTTPNISLRLQLFVVQGAIAFMLVIVLILVSAVMVKIRLLTPEPGARKPIDMNRGSIKASTYNDAGQYWDKQIYPRGTCTQQDGNGFYSLSANDLDNNKIDFDRYRNKVVLVTNVAFFADESVTQYQGFEYLLSNLTTINTDQHVAGRGFEVLAFPCSQFGRQVGPKPSEIRPILANVRPGNGFQSSAQHFSPIDVNGLDTHPVYQHLRTRCRNPRRNLLANKHDLFWSPVSPSDITGNFEKFLVDAQGRVRFRYPSQKWSVRDLESDIRSLMIEKYDT